MARILIIDDDETIRVVLLRTLVNAGHSVEQAGDGRAGLRALEREPFDLVVTDIVMPETEGLELMMRVRELRPRSKIIVMSGGGRLRDPGYLKTARLLGADEVLAKPFGGAEFVVIVEAVLARDPETEPPAG
jgi:two-component system cell cycle response regulator CpdR